MENFRFYKTERLCSRADFELLFSNSESIFVYPFKVVFRVVPFEEREELKLGISVSKRNFKRAVKRNFVKRRIREGFRLHKHILKQTLGKQNIGIHLMLVYVSKELMEFGDMEPKIATIVEKISKILEERAGVASGNSN